MNPALASFLFSGSNYGLHHLGGCRCRLKTTLMGSLCSTKLLASPGISWLSQEKQSLYYFISCISRNLSLSDNKPLTLVILIFISIPMLTSFKGSYVSKLGDSRMMANSYPEALFPLAYQP